MRTQEHTVDKTGEETHSQRALPLPCRQILSRMRRLLLRRRSSSRLSRSHVVAVGAIGLVAARHVHVRELVLLGVVVLEFLVGTVASAAVA